MANEFGGAPNLGSRRVYSPPNVTEYPKMLWGPKGERKLFNSAAEVPPGWGSLSPTDAAAAATAAAAKPTPAAAPVAKPGLKVVPPAPPAPAAPAAPAAPPAPPAPAAPLTRQEISAALKQGGVEFKPLAPLAELTELLVASLQTHLTDVGIKFPEDADARALLALVTPPTKPTA